VAANSSYRFTEQDIPCWDRDGDALTHAVVTPPQHGTLSAPDAQGTRTYRPADPTWTGDDSFTVTANDGRSSSEVATVEIQVTAPVEVTADAPPLPSGEPVGLQNYVSPSGKSLITVPHGEVSRFPGSCMPLDVDTTISAGSNGGTVSSVRLVLDPPAGGTSEQFPMTQSTGEHWTAHIDCVRAGDLSVEWTLTEGATTQALSKPLGGIMLIDPQGVVYDKTRYDAAVASGSAPDDARSQAVVAGATVVLQRRTGGTWATVSSGDPGISPNVNPQVTHADGLFRWDVSAGTYRVVVSRPGYDAVTSEAVNIPPPATSLHVALTPAPAGSGASGDDTGGGDGDGDRPDQDPTGPASAGTTPRGGGPPGITTPQVPPKPKPAPCSGLKGQKRAACESKQRLKRALAKCSKLKGKKRDTCVKRAKARAKCDRLSGRKKTACVKRANAIGRRKR
jgi:hypothetical protein